jgi:flagellar motor switch protein FliM
MDILSQSEIDTLLNALSKGEVNIEDLSETAEQVNYKNYDFRRPNKFSKEQLRNLQALHGVFARILSNYLTGYLRANIQLEVVSVDQITYEDFINSIPIPTVLTVFSLEPLKGTAIMQFDPMFLFPMLDLFFGGKGDAPHTFRDFTDIELTVARNLSEKILENLSIAWRDIVQVDAQVLSLETNPRLHQIFSFNEIVALITLNVQIGDSTKGMLNLCQASISPTSAIETLKRTLILSIRLFSTRRFSFKELASPIYSSTVSIPTTKSDTYASAVKKLLKISR